MIDKFTRNVIRKSIVENFDDSAVIYLDFNSVSSTQLNQLELAHFNVINIPCKSFDKDISNFYCSFFESNKSDTGYVAMFTNKSKTVYYNQKHINKHNYNIGYI